MYSSEHNGCRRVVVCADAVAWVLERPTFPSRCHVVTSLPDIHEIKPRVSCSEYAEWFVGMVSQLLRKLDPEAVAIFYQTDGRNSAEGDTYLDKSFLCHRGAQEAGASCLWHRIVLAAAPNGQPRSGRPTYAHMLCFSRRFRPGRSALAWSDVIPARGHMAYAGAMGETACAEAIAFCVDVQRVRDGRNHSGAAGRARDGADGDIGRPAEGSIARPSDMRGGDDAELASLTRELLVEAYDAESSSPLSELPNPLLDSGLDPNICGLASEPADGKVADGEPADDRPDDDRLIDGESSSTTEVDLDQSHVQSRAFVLDPFCGHGTVLVLANAFGCDALGIDNNFSRCEVAVRRVPHSSTGGLTSGLTLSGSSVVTCNPRTCDGDHPHCRPS